MNYNDQNNEQKDKDLDQENEVEQDSSELFEFDSPEDLQRFLNDLSDNEKIKKRQIIGFTNRLVKNMYLNLLLFLALNTTLIFAIDGYLDLIKHESTLSLLYFSVMFTVIEVVLKEILYRYFPALIFMTIGVIIIIVYVIALVIPLLVIKDFSFKNVSSFIFFFLIFSIIRTMITQYIIQRKRLKITRKKI